MILLFLRQNIGRQAKAVNHNRPVDVKNPVFNRFFRVGRRLGDHYTAYKDTGLNVFGWIESGAELSSGLNWKTFLLQKFPQFIQIDIYSLAGRQDKVPASVSGAGFFKKTVCYFLRQAVRLHPAHPAAIHGLHFQNVEFKFSEINIEQLVQKLVNR